MTHQTKPRTWAEQKEYERQIRREWLEHVCRTYAKTDQAARAINLERKALYNQARDYGVKLPSERAAELMRDNGELMNVILQRKSALMAEGYTEEQALRAIAHQMGVSV